MKRLLLIFPFFLLLSGCNVSEDCFKNSGAMQTKELPVAAEFNKIYVYPNISLVLREGSDYSIAVKAGSNVIDDIEAKIVDGSLELRDNSGCNLNRQYGNKTVYVTTPHHTEFEIYSNTAQKIISDGTITHDIFRLYAMDYFGGVGTGDFIMNVENLQFVILSNNVSLFRITGHANELSLNFYDDLSRCEAQDFIAQKVSIFQRSANDMIVNPVEEIAGTIYSTGNVICKNHPPVVNVQRVYTGRLIYD